MVKTFVVDDCPYAHRRVSLVQVSLSFHYQLHMSTFARKAKDNMILQLRQLRGDRLTDKRQEIADLVDRIGR